LFIDEKEKDRGSMGCGIRGSVSMGFSIRYKVSNLFVKRRIIIVVLRIIALLPGVDEYEIVK
jgi:hypothetical protein